MIRHLRPFRALLLAVALGAGTAQAGERVISVDGAVTEIAYALGQGHRLVAVDTSSAWPAETAGLPKVGYKRALTAEGLLSLRPTMVLATKAAGPAQALEPLRTLGVAVVTVPDDASVDGVLAKVRGVAAALDAAPAGEALAARIGEELATVRRRLEGAGPPPRVLFLMDTGRGGLMAAGRGTAADAVIALAGGANAFDAAEGLKPLTPEAAVAARPDLVVVTEQAIRRMGGPDRVTALPELALTPAARAGRFVTIDALLVLGFGPRIGEAVRTLAEAFHPGLPARTAEAGR